MPLTGFVQPAPSNHWNVYGGVPPRAVVTSVMTVPWLIVGFTGDMKAPRSRMEVVMTEVDVEVDAVVTEVDAIVVYLDVDATEVEGAVVDTEVEGTVV